MLKARTLSTQQKAFADAYAEIPDQSKAYISAGYLKPGDTADKRKIALRAYQVYKSPHVQAEIARVISGEGLKTIKQVAFTADAHEAYHRKLRDKAEIKGDYTSATSNHVAIGKMHAVYSDNLLVSGNHQQAMDVREANEARRLASMMLRNRAIDVEARVVGELPGPDVTLLSPSALRDATLTPAIGQDQGADSDQADQEGGKNDSEAPRYPQTPPPVDSE